MTVPRAFALSLMLCACSSGGTDPSSGTGGTSTSSSATTASGPGGSGGGTGGSGASSTTSASSSGTGGAAHGCAGHDYKLCEDFEGANDGDVPAGWIKRHPYSSDPNAAVQTEVGVASDQAHWGSKSLKSSSDKCAQTRAQKSLSDLGATAGTHWGRVFIRVKTPAPLTDPNCNCYYHETFVGLGPNATDESRVVDTTESPAGDVYYLYNVPDDSFGRGTDTSYHYEDKWQCAEWYIDDQTDSYRFFLDGQEIIHFENEAGAKIKQFSDLSVGSICYILPLAPTNFTAWFDDLAIDDKRIGCD